jgi:sialate O-acetylesterase
VIWSQGAAAPERAFQYRSLFRALIREWRRAWGVEDLPFLFVQEAAFGPRRDEPGEHSWAELREAQAMALSEPNTAMAVALDCGEAANIHPRRKIPVAERLALAARAIAYGEPLEWSGPRYRGMTVEGAGIRVRFDHAAGGLATADGAAPRGFAVSAGAGSTDAGNRGFTWAGARIEGRDVVVSSPAVPHPVAVRYAWAQNPDANLINAAGLPAAPFRSDDWPGVTVHNL